MPNTEEINETVESEVDLTNQTSSGGSEQTGTSAGADVSDNNDSSSMVDDSSSNYEKIGECESFVKRYQEAVDSKVGPYSAVTEGNDEHHNYLSWFDNMMSAITGFFGSIGSFLKKFLQGPFKYFAAIAAVVVGIVVVILFTGKGKSKTAISIGGSNDSIQ